MRGDGRQTEGGGGVDEGDRCAFMTQVGYLGGGGVSQRVQVISMSRSAQKSAI